jgi:large repetitive protein
MRDAISGREGEAAIGLRNLWDLGKGLRLNTNFERVHPVAGGESNQSTAVALGLDYIGSQWWKGSTRLELRDGSSSDSLLSTLGAAVKLNRDWTFLGRNILSITQNQDAAGGERIQERLQLGMAYRDTDTDVWNALGKIELRHEKDGTQPGINLRRATQIVSLHGNYQPSKPLIWSGRVASKWVQDRSNGLDTKYNAHLVSGRMILEISKRWDLSMQASSHFSNNFKTQQYGLGLEVGYLLTQNLWLAGGYNLFGFEDEDLVDGDYTNPGWYARLRFKFDETVFAGHDPRVNPSVAPRVTTK